MKRKLFTFFLFLVFLYLPAYSYASYNFKDASGLSKTAEPAGFQTDGEGFSLENNISIFINIVLSLIGVLFVILIIYGGILWMTAQGNDEQVKKARRIIFDSVTGLIIVVAAYAITWFVIYSFSNV